MTIDEVEDLLYHRSGLLGVSGISDDLRWLLASDRPEVATVEVFCYRVNRELGRLAAALGRLDVLVVAGSIGENAPRIRSSICADASWLGVQIDEAANLAGEQSLHSEGTTPAVYIIPTDHEVMMAHPPPRQCRSRGRAAQMSLRPAEGVVDRGRMTLPSGLAPM